MTKLVNSDSNSDLAKPYEPTPRERAAVEDIVARRKELTPSPRLKVSTNEAGTQISPDHPEIAVGQLQLMSVLGTLDAGFYDGILRHLVGAATQGSKVDETQLNFMLAVIKGTKPKDELETMLAAQMAAVHMASMTFARRLAHVENIQQQDSAAGAFNKLVRTFAAQLEALKRYRTGGEQKVTVKHVTVKDGGQAIVGNVSHRGGGRSQIRRATS